jgi:hypothetical protein
MKDLAQMTLKLVRRRWSDERGVALIITAGSMIALTSAVALAIDVGMLTVARSEAQSAADGAALAGAGMLIDSPKEGAGAARARARESASENSIRGQRANVLDEDVDVDVAARTVTVRVLRTETRDNAIGTFFARIFGVNTVNISAAATARASYAGGINCLLPLALPDRWNEAGGPGNDANDFNPDMGDTYIPWMDTSTQPATINDETFTGYSADDIGQEIVLKSNGTSGLNPSWYYPWRPPGQSGGSDYRENVRSCVDPSISYAIGQEVESEPGNMVGPTKQGFGDLIDLDPQAVWNDNMDCVTDSQNVFSNDGAHCRHSPRVRPIPMFDPTGGPPNGSKPFQFTNFAGVFVDRIQGNDVIAHWIGYRGLDPAEEPGGASTGPQFKVLQLID